MNKRIEGEGAGGRRGRDYREKDGDRSEERRVVNEAEKKRGP